MKNLCWLLLLVTFPTFAQRTFTNPIKSSGPDPWVWQDGGWYYYMNTTGRDLTLWRTRNIADLATAESKVIYTPPTGTAYSRDLWAPEIHKINGAWYIYVAADSLNNLTHRIWVLENTDADPFAGTWTMKGKLTDPGDHWAIDLTILQHKGKLYASWSGWEGQTNGRQDIYIARLKNPWTMRGDRVKIAQPQYGWELHGKTPEAWHKTEPREVLVNEGPEFLQNGRKTFIVYSANACWLDYCLGLLEHTGGSMLKARNWRKHPQPVFTQSPENKVWAPGHGGFFTTNNGATNWMIYHANPSETDGCGNKRAPHMQTFSWNPDGTPNFGKPIPKVSTAMP
ncbi:MAG: glycosyl hydrolase family 43 [Cytophagales bacterium]|nr:MAG: glycosyl hydrolase family 43 [Cytophagales bacterium]